MFETDPLADIKTSYENWGKSRGKRPGGTVVPFVNSECWYQSSQQNKQTGQWEQASEEQVANATEEAIDWLGEKPLAGLNLYSQQAFRRLKNAGRISWPSRSGLGQHSQTGETGGLTWSGIDFVNYWDSSKPPWVPTATCEAQTRAAKRFLGYEVSVARTRRPTVLIEVTRGQAPVPDAYIYATPLSGAISNTIGMRTDADGAAWFELRDPGVWRFSVKDGKQWKQTEVNAPLQPIDIGAGGPGPVIEAQIELAD
jgi:hypothetical protein